MAYFRGPKPPQTSDNRSPDVRVIATTNRDLEQMVRDGEFREELYYRLNVVVIALLPAKVEVSTSAGIVTLRGWVGSYYQKQVAQVAPSTVIGRRRLVNEIEVG
jgi:transcriptional regulator of aromatic amino acid metabolism